MAVNKFTELKYFTFLINFVFIIRNLKALDIYIQLQRFIKEVSIAKQCIKIVLSREVPNGPELISCGGSGIRLKE